MKAAIIAIGSELLSGQITNRNAAWISGKLFELGIDTLLHMTVDDVESAIINALEQAARQCDIIVTTGGLGPTSDDLTRQVVARWVGEGLRYDSESWQHIEAIFAKLGVSAPETNRRQCYFPSSAEVLENSAGTANAFAMTAHNRRLWVLPGPPREVEAVWSTHVAAAMQRLVPEAERQTLRMWRTVGRGESHIAEIVEPIAAQTPGLELAFRAHAPIIETKIRFPSKQSAVFTPICEKVSLALAPWLYETDYEDIAKELIARLQQFQVIDVYDGACQGYLSELLTPLLRQHLLAESRLSFAMAWENHDEPRAFIEQMLALDQGGGDGGVRLAVAGFDVSNHWAVGLRWGEQRLVQEIHAPYQGHMGSNILDRNRRSCAALAVKAWRDMLISMPCSDPLRKRILQ